MPKSTTTPSEDKEYDLIQKERSRLELRQMLLDGYNSPSSEQICDDQYFKRLREKAMQRTKSAQT